MFGKHWISISYNKHLQFTICLSFQQVDQKKLAKAENKLRQKKEKRALKDEAASSDGVPIRSVQN